MSRSKNILTRAKSERNQKWSSRLRKKISAANQITGRKLLIFERGGFCVNENGL